MTPQSATSLSAAVIRQQFIEFFTSKHEHLFVPSSPVVPHDDPTLLFTNAGMNQYKPIFLGQADPSSDMASWKRAANSQKCIRAGGKHNDLDDVGKDTYHHTFFEMLGNWSFGDYFKAEAIKWAWELLVDQWGLDTSRLYATYFEGNKAEGLEPDHEARDLWLALLPPERVMPGDMQDNFWEMGDTGPCGPCSELHYDSRPDAEREQIPGHSLVNMDHDQVIEIWNLVFIQFDRQPGSLKPLPAKHVDTGMGLERIVRVLQGATSNYDTDLFTPLFNAIKTITGAPDYAGSLDSLPDTAYRVIADHIRTLTFAIADGATPSNEGRGYVLRSILRRAVFYGKFHLKADDGFLHKLVPIVVETMGEFFPELKKQQLHVAEILADEEAAFGKTLTKGYDFWKGGVAKAIAESSPKENAPDLAPGDDYQLVVEIDKEKLPVPNLSIMAPAERCKIKLWSDDESRFCSVLFSELSSETVAQLFETVPQMNAQDAFRLHDTYGFPIGLTRLMAEERGITVDEDGFERLMEEAREKSRAGGKDGGHDPVRALPADRVAELQKFPVPPTGTSGVFQDGELSTNVIVIWDGTQFLFDAPEGAHVAVICAETSFYAQMGGQVGDTGTISFDEAVFEVEDTQVCAGYVLHIGHSTRGKITSDVDVSLSRNGPRRNAIARNHTCTHLLNLALRDVLGPNVDQKGSLVAPDRLRFDFSHNAPISQDELVRTTAHIEKIVADDLAVYAEPAPLDTAKQINSLRAVFGETYPDPVRIVSVGVPIPDLLADASRDDWKNYSIEFCGGTHVASTSQIQLATITEEEAVAKGVRRIVMLTGNAAREAIDTGMKLRARTQVARSLNGTELSEEIAAIQSDLESRTVSLIDAHIIRESLDQLREKLKAAQKESAKAGKSQAVDAARELADSSSDSIVVGAIPAGGDRQALLAAMDCVRGNKPDAAIMLASVDDESGKVALAASCTKDNISAGLKAGDWVREVSGVLGGKGGGRPDSAQGGGTDASKLDEALKRASSFASDNLST